MFESVRNVLEKRWCSFIRAKEKSPKTLSVSGLFWSECRDSNSRPLEPHSSAIPNFATPGYSCCLKQPIDNTTVLFLFQPPISNFLQKKLQFFLLTKPAPHGNILLASGSRGAFAYGEMAEWSKAPVLKTGDVKASVGSNPTLSASNFISAEVPKWPKGLPC